MFTRPPDLPDSVIADVVESGWELAVDSIEYAPVGFGSHHWIVTAAHRLWFVTVDCIAPRNEGPDKILQGFHRLEAALKTARLLHDLGLTFVLSPIPTTEGRVLIPIGDRYVGTVYPFVEGRTFAWGGFADRNLSEAVLERLVTLHTAPRTAQRYALAEDFRVPGRAQLRAALADKSWRSSTGVYEGPTRSLLARSEGMINEHLARYDRLVNEVSQRLEPWVVTHGEPHPANTIVTSEGVVLVDWDTLLIAPPERDLWWLASEDAELLAVYEEQTASGVDRAALDLYRLRWDLTDLALFADQLLSPHDDDQDARTAWEALSNFLA